MTKMMDTITLIPYISLGHELTPNYESRTILWSHFNMATAFGVMLGIMIPGSKAGPDCADTPDTGCMYLP